MNNDKGSLIGPGLGAIIGVLGVVLAASARSLTFPVGCNVSYTCQPDPVGTWSTLWPNVLTFFLGIVLAGYGLGKVRSRRFPLAGLGIALILDGVALLTMGFITGYATSCLSNGGCLGPTGSAWWDLYWPNVVAVSLGAALVVVGSTLALVAKKAHGVSLSKSPQPGADPRFKIRKR